MPRIKPTKPSDWTEAFGAANSSPEYTEMLMGIEKLIENQSRGVISMAFATNAAGVVSRWLAHTQNIGPREEIPRLREKIARLEMDLRLVHKMAATLPRSSTVETILATIDHHTAREIRIDDAYRKLNCMDANERRCLDCGELSDRCQCAELTLIDRVGLQRDRIKP